MLVRSSKRGLVTSLLVLAVEGDPTGNRTPIYAVKGRRPNR